MFISYLEVLTPLTAREDNLKTFQDPFTDVKEPDNIKFDVCVTAVFLLPLLFIPNMISEQNIIPKVIKNKFWIKI